MGHVTQVFGQISVLQENADIALESIAEFAFDDTYPFPNIFWPHSPAQYLHGGIMFVFGGAFKQLEEDWDEWSEKFWHLLNEMKADEANVLLRCRLGEFNWSFGRGFSQQQLRTLAWPENEQMLTRYIEEVNRLNNISNSLESFSFPHD